MTTCINIDGFTKTGGEWSLKNIVRTGFAFGTVIFLCAPQSPPIGTAGARTFDSTYFRRITDSLLPALRVESDSLEDVVRTTSEELHHIRAVLNPSITELGNMFSVSRQAIYNWLAGETPSSSHTKKINELAAAADVIKDEGISVTTHILRRKIKDGKSLFEIVQDGGSGKESAQVLAEILRRESNQRKRLDQRLANRAKPPIDALDIGLPAFDEQV